MSKLVQLDREQRKRLGQEGLVELNLVLQRQLAPGNERTDLCLPSIITSSG